MALNNAVLEKWYEDTVKLKYAFAGETPPEQITLPPVTTIDGLLEGIVEETYEALVNAAIANGYENTTIKVAYAYKLPSELWRWFGINLIGGETISFNQFVAPEVTEVSTISGHKYYTLINGIASIITSDGSNIMISDDMADMVMDLTLMFGYGKEPNTVNAVKSIFPAEHYAANSGELLSAGVVDVVSRNSNDDVLQTYSVPTEIQELDGYGRSAGSIYNYMDFKNKKFIKKLNKVDLGTLTYTYLDAYQLFYAAAPDDSRSPKTGGIEGICGKYNVIIDTFPVFTSRDRVIQINTYSFSVLKRILIRDADYGSGDEAKLKAALDGVELYYELQTQEETDISAYLSGETIITAESNGSIVFKNKLGDDYQIPVPSLLDYVGRS